MLVRCPDQEIFRALTVVGVMIRRRLEGTIRGTFGVRNARMFDGIALISRLPHSAAYAIWSVVKSSSLDHGMDLFVLRSCRVGWHGRRYRKMKPIGISDAEKPRGHRYFKPGRGHDGVQSLNLFSSHEEINIAPSYVPIAPRLSSQQFLRLRCGSLALIFYCRVLFAIPPSSRRHGFRTRCHSAHSCV